MEKLGEKIWRLREKKGLSQEALAEMLDVSRQTVSNWENDRATPDAYKLKLLCEALGVSADELLGMGEPVPAPQERDLRVPEEENGSVGRNKGRALRIALPVLLGAIAAILLAAAIALFTLPAEEKSQAITSAFTLTPTMGGIFLLALSLSVLVAVTVILFKKK